MRKTLLALICLAAALPFFSNAYAAVNSNSCTDLIGTTWQGLTTSNVPVSIKITSMDPSHRVHGTIRIGTFTSSLNSYSWCAADVDNAANVILSLQAGGAQSPWMFTPKSFNPNGVQIPITGGFNPTNGKPDFFPNFLVRTDT